MGDTTVNPEWITTDLSLTAYLQLRGFAFLRMERVDPTRPMMQFVFMNADGLESAASEFFHSSEREYYDLVRSLKGRIHNALAR